ncbi:aspartyl/asparaginyl beta-hydroxylase domain-containing protein [Iodidimonas sp. SYSU 1G8]|uniref:aspartyl/asparaginyl beta-hydroxylase domain-containing protein n=1 Tax=Iodidimonas sp. SYSU 1G8 TaxID=3133967 RepID=UPI0031FE47B4
MTVIGVLLLALVVVVGVAALVVHRLDGPSKLRLRDAANNVFARAEDAGKICRLPAFVHDYHGDYPALRAVEAAYPDIRREVLDLLQIKDRIMDIKDLGGNYTAGGIHTIQWKSFVLKAGLFVDENCRRAPKTAEALRQVPGLYTAFFSILDPHQYITPHYGYWKGFVRYHLAVFVPDDNRDNACWLRINADPADNATGDKSLVERGEKYFWKNGQGVMFDDAFLHDAANGSGQVRVVMWLDIMRRMPLHLRLFNRFCLLFFQLDPSIRRIRKNAVTIG